MVYLPLLALETKIDKLANNVDPDEVAYVAYDEPPHLDLHCLHSDL